MIASTLDPEYVRALPARCAHAGVAILDTPISGGPAKAHDGTMTIMVAGPSEARERVAPVLEAIAARRFAISDRVGDAAATKIVNNLLAGANLAAAAEALALAEALGLDVRATADVIAASSGASWIFADRVPRALAGDYVPRAASRILAKDVGIACDVARRATRTTPSRRRRSARSTTRSRRATARTTTRRSCAERASERRRPEGRPTTSRVTRRRGSGS
jgi:3-hydroxyisobutyrate dehydrogenase-like beta-hydroxyacid dehydrogenase